jgi:hypothetical protein
MTKPTDRSLYLLLCAFLLVLLSPRHCSLQLIQSILCEEELRLTRKLTTKHINRTLSSAKLRRLRNIDIYWIVIMVDRKTQTKICRDLILCVVQNERNDV